MNNPIIKYQIRRMTQDDVNDVIVIENEIHPFPWSEQIFRDCIKVGYICWVVLENNTKIVGFGVTTVSAGECHILNVTITASSQGNGLGKRLMLHILNIAKQCGAKKAMLEVRISNDRAYKLYEKLGFVNMCVRKDYYPAVDGREDAYILEKVL